MRFIDTTSNCNITQSSFLNDLVPYTVETNDDGTYLKWSDDNSTTPINFRSLDGRTIFDLACTSNNWTPYFFTDDEYIYTKAISHYGSLLNDSDLPSGRIGIEDYITFTPKFNNWDTSGLMTIDWILNRYNTPYNIVGGLLCWGKNPTPIIGTIDEFPLYSKLKYRNNIYLKIDTNKLRLIGPNPSPQYRFRSDNITFTYTGEYADIDTTTLDDPTLTLYGSDEQQLWVADGDQIFYYFNRHEQRTLNQRRRNLGHRSFISATLYKYYTNIYNAITSEQDIIFSNNPAITNFINRAAKRLAHSLATSPFASEFFINILANPSQDLKDIIHNYINSTQHQSNTIFKLNETLVSISEYLNKYEISSQDNIITNNKELFNKLLAKYGAKLKLEAQGNIFWKNKLKYGDSVIIQEASETLIPKEVTNSVVINNKEILLDQLSVKTNMSDTGSTIELKKNGIVSNTIYLYDSVKPDIGRQTDGSVFNARILIAMRKNNNVDPNWYGNKAPPPIFEGPDYDPNRSTIFYWGSVPDADGAARDSTTNWKRYGIGLRATDIVAFPKYPAIDNSSEKFVEEQFIITWTQESGDPLRFIDPNKSDTKTYDSVTGTDIIILPNTTGKFVIKCTVDCPFGSFTQFKTIFVVDGRPMLYRKDEKNRVFYDDNPNFGTYADKYPDHTFPPPLLQAQDFFFGIDVPNTPDQDGNIIEAPNDYLDNSLKYRLKPEGEELLEAENTRPIILNRDGIRVYKENLSNIAIHRNGLFAALSTKHYMVLKRRAGDEIERLAGDNYKFLFDESNDIDPITRNSNLNINYFLNNTIIKLDRIILKNLRNNTPECSQCDSLYVPKFRSFKGNNRAFYYRANIAPDVFTIQRFIYNPTTQRFDTRSDDIETSITHKYPKISTDLAPAIKGFGNYASSSYTNTILDSTYSAIPVTINKLVSGGPRVESEQGGIEGSIPYHTSSTLPSITGYDLSNVRPDLPPETNRDIFCIQQPLMPMGHIDGYKGVFIPHSGWVIGDTNNLSSVLKFNPGARYSYSFNGPGILNLSNNSSYNRFLDIPTKKFSSSIEIDINPDIRYDHGGDYCTLPNESERSKKIKRAAVEGKYYIQNQMLREFGDQLVNTTLHSYHHGYRILNGGYPHLPERNTLSNTIPQNDEFNIGISKQENKFAYGFNVVGPNNPINTELPREVDLYINSGIGPGLQQPPGVGGNESDFMDVVDWLLSPAASSFGLRNPRVNNLTIKDIEIKLNFLNYVNTKDLVIWLDIEICDGEQTREGTETADGDSSGGRVRGKPCIFTENAFVDGFIPSNTHNRFGGTVGSTFTESSAIPINSSGLKDFAIALTNMNSYDRVGPKRKVYLLNRQNIQNKEFSFNIKFSDHAGTNNTLFDYSAYNLKDNNIGSISANQHIIQNNDTIRPTTFVTGYSTKENCYYSSLLNLQNINIVNNSFNKFSDRQLFQSADAPDNFNCSILHGKLRGKTKFTLNIAVVDESDQMMPIDTISSTDIYTNLSSTQSKLSSPSLLNNLCSWELILHTEDVRKPTTSCFNTLSNYGGTESLGLIEYGKNPSYPGYGFIMNLKDKQFLLPFANINAPSLFFQNASLCEYADPELIGKGVVINSPRFPTEAIIAIIASITSAAFAGGGSLIGTLAGLAGANQGYEPIFEFFKEARFVPLLEGAQRETYEMNYDNYPMGNSDKILINASKDGCFWYKMEASIFRLDNTPALPLKEFKFMKPDHRKSAQDNKLFKFDSNIISDNSDIIDELFIPLFQQQIENQLTEDGSELSEEQRANIQDINHEIYDQLNFLDNEIFISFNKFLNNQKDIFAAKKENNTLLIIDNTLPYYLFDINDSVNFIQPETDNSNEDSETNDESINCQGHWVTAKALVFKDGSYKTILAINRENSNPLVCGEIKLPDNVILMYDNNSTIEYNSRNEPTESPISLFGLGSVSSNIYNDIPDNIFSASSLGSYGNGSVLLNKNILSKKLKLYYIEPVSKLFNNFLTSRCYKNTIQLISSLFNTSINTSHQKFEAYPVYYDGDNIQLIDKPEFHISSDNSIEAIISNKINQYNSIYNKDFKYNIMYLKINGLEQNILDSISETESGSDNMIHGSIFIENAYDHMDSLRALTEDEKTLLVNRLNTLNVSDLPEIDSLIGEANKTSTILNTNSIFYIQQHYNALQEDQYDSDFTNRANLPNKYPKSATGNKLNKLINERDEIFKLLDKTTYKQANITLINNLSYNGTILYENNTVITLVLVTNETRTFNKSQIKDITYSYSIQSHPNQQFVDNSILTQQPDPNIFTNKVLPQTMYNIRVDNQDNSISIIYDNNFLKDYYWLNIDPKQSCSLAEELRPKVLKKVKYVCDDTNPAQGIINYHSVCPETNRLQSAAGEDIEIGESSPGRVEYIIPSVKVESEKNIFLTKFGEHIHGWKEQTIERKFRVYSDKVVGAFAGSVETLVTVTETYDVAMTQIEAGIEDAKRRGLQDQAIIKDLISKNIIKSDNSADITRSGLLNGLGREDRYTNISRVYNIFNLDDINNLKIQIRKVPRMIRGIDNIGAVFRYGTNVTYKPISQPPLDPLDLWGVGKTESLINNFYYWQCYMNTDNIINKIPTPAVYKHMNEIWYRAFYGSADGLEYKSEKLNSYYDWEAVPLEYFTNFRQQS